MTQQWMYEAPPLELISERREELSETLQNERKLDAEDRQWLRGLIREYDKAIRVLMNNAKTRDDTEQIAVVPPSLDKYYKEVSRG